MQIEDLGIQAHPALLALRIQDQDGASVGLNELEVGELRQFLNRRAGDDSLFLLVIDHRRDTTYSLHYSREDAQAAIAGWVEQWWDQEMGDQPKPGVIDQAAIDRYFARVHDEFPSIQPIGLDQEPAA
jgi:hypothetical protein